MAKFLLTTLSNAIVNSLAPGRFKWNFGLVIFKLTLVTDGWVISCEIPLSRMSLNLNDDKSALVQVMAWCHQATSHYLNQCWPRSMSPYGVTRPQWVNEISMSLIVIYCTLGIILFSVWKHGSRGSAYPCSGQENTHWGAVPGLWGKYRQTSNISHTWVGNEIADHSDVIGASPVGAAPTTSSFST